MIVCYDILMRKTPDERFWVKVDTSPGEGACWPWIGALKDSGYGVFWDGSRLVPAHRYAIGDTASLLDADHLCHNDTDCRGGPTCLHRRCCNPAHLELVSHAVNLLRSHIANKASGWKDQCHRGHDYNDENTYIDTTGHQRCRSCAKIHQRAHKERKKVAA